MMTLNDMLTCELTDEEYLARQRERHRARCERAIADVRRRADDAEYIRAAEERARPIMDNMFVLPGSGGVRMHVGTPPAWNECRTDDEEYLWHLNRMEYFSKLTELYLLTGEERYAEKVFGDMLYWIDLCPMMPLPEDLTAETASTELCRFYGGLTPWRSLEVGIRAFSTWNRAYIRLLLSELMTPERHTKLVRFFYEHALVLRAMSPIYWPKANHNHYIHEMLGLLQIACLFPEMKATDEWTPFALYELERCAVNQFTADGGQIEGNPGYHSGCLHMFFDMAELCRDYGIELSPTVQEVYRKATEYVTFTVMPEGTWAAIGDTAISKDAGRSTTVEYYRCFGDLGPTERLFAIQSQYDPLQIPEQVQAVARERAATLPGGDMHQRWLGQYMARTGWRPTDSAFMFICKTPIVNGHTHQDPMSFVLTLKGDPVVIDPSYFAYRNCPERKLFKSPEYHSCLTFDGKPPYEFVSVWGYTPQREGHIRKSYRTEGLYAADASHHNYEPDYHKRLCALLGEDVFLVADEVVNATGTDVRLYFHMDDPTLRLEGDTAVSERVRVLLPKGLEAEVVPSNKSPYTDLLAPTSRIILRDPSHENALYLTVFTKRADVSEPSIERTADGVRISVKVGEETKALLWKFARTLEFVN